MISSDFGKCVKKFSVCVCVRFCGILSVCVNQLQTKQFEILRLAIILFNYENISGEKKQKTRKILYSIDKSEAF